MAAANSSFHKFSGLLLLHFYNGFPYKLEGDNA